METVSTENIENVEASQLIAELPVAIVHGESVANLPKDLYIPPDALRIFLEAFEGPLDLLLYLIKHQNLDILDIPIAEITKQYVQYVELMHELQFELAADYLVMAAVLAEIKSRMLLPRPESMDEEEEDPRAELIRRLQEYEQFKKAAEALDTLPREGRDVFTIQAEVPDIKISAPPPDVDLREILMALKDVMMRVDLTKHHQVKLETMSVREKMSHILGHLTPNEFVEFKDLFILNEGRLGVVVTFLALLELLKESLIELVQNEPYSPIHVKAI